MNITRKIDGKLYPYDVPTAKDAIAFSLNDDEREIICEIGDMIRKQTTKTSKESRCLIDSSIIYSINHKKHPNVRRSLIEQYLAKVLDYKFHIFTRRIKGEVVFDYEISWN